MSCPGNRTLPQLMNTAMKEWDFVGSSEITFMDKEKRNILTVTYKGGGGGSILFHQASWDPVFLADIDPEEPLDLGKLLADEVSGPHALIYMPCILVDDLVTTAAGVLRRQQSNITIFLFVTIW